MSLLSTLQTLTKSNTEDIAKEVVPDIHPPKPHSDEASAWCAAIQEELQSSAERGYSCRLVIFADRSKTVYDGSTRQQVEWSSWMWGRGPCIPTDLAEWNQSSRKAITKLGYESRRSYEVADARFDTVFLAYLKELTELWRSHHPELQVEVVNSTTSKYQKPYCFYPGQLEPGETKTKQTCGLRFDWSAVDNESDSAPPQQKRTKTSNE